MLLRPLEKQFEAKTVKKIREQIESFRNLNLPGGPCHYYVIEIMRALEAGLLLAAIELSASLLELSLRELVFFNREKSVISDHEFGPFLGKLARRFDLEYERNMMFTQLMDELESTGFASHNDTESIKRFYKETRIPIHHGLSGRYVAKSQECPSGDFFSVLSSTSIHSFEDALEKNTLDDLRLVTSFLSKFYGKRSEA